jgi:hypothetical protein
MLPPSGTTWTRRAPPEFESTNEIGAECLSITIPGLIAFDQQPRLRWRNINMDLRKLQFSIKRAALQARSGGPNVDLL